MSFADRVIALKHAGFADPQVAALLNVPIADVNASELDPTHTAGQAAHVAAPSGGSTVDTQARAQLSALITALQNAGILAAS